MMQKYLPRAAFVVATVVALIIGALIWAYIIGMLIAVGRHIEKTQHPAEVQCGKKWADFEFQYSVAAGCRVKIDGRWVPEHAVAISPKNEGPENGR